MADFDPEDTALAVRRALARTLASNLVKRSEGNDSTYLAIPVDHLPYVQEDELSADLDIDWCIALDGKVHIAGGRAIICDMPKGTAHACKAMTLRTDADHSYVGYWTKNALVSAELESAGLA